MNKLDRQFINWFFESTAVVVLFTVVGNMLDQRFHTSPNILSTGLLLALCLEGWNLYKILKNTFKK